MPNNGFTPSHDKYISQITLPNGTTYYIKDAEARQWINELVAGGLTFKVAWNGEVPTTEAEKTAMRALIPEGVVVKYGSGSSDTMVGTLAPSADTKPYIYLVKMTNNATRDAFEEYVTIQTGTNPDTYAWEKLGDTEINFSNLGELAWKDSVTLNKGNGDIVLGEDTTFTNSTSSVTFTNDAHDTFVKSYPGTSSKLETTTIKGVGADVSFTAVNANTSVTATNTVFGTDTTASKIETESKTATNTIFGTATTASKATAGTAVSLAKPAGSATNVSYIGNNNTASILETATVAANSETLVLGSVSVTQGSVTGINGSQSITPYTFADVTVPVVSSNAQVTVGSVKTNTDVTVPVVTSNTEVTATNTTTVPKTAATSAANATTVATGSLKANDTVGATIMTGLGTAVTASAVTDIGTGTAAAQSITVGTNDRVKVAVYDDLSVTVS